MSEKKDKLNLTSPTAVAIEIAAAGLIAWKLKNAFDRRYDPPDAPEPLGYPMHEYARGAETYIYTAGAGPLTVGTLDPQEGCIQISVEGKLQDDGKPEITIKEPVAEADPRRLAILLERISVIRSEWQEKVTQAIPNYLQRD